MTAFTEQSESAKDRWPHSTYAPYVTSATSHEPMATTKNAASSVKPKASLGALGR